MSLKYILLKLAEEAGEVVVAAVKHQLHRTPATRRELELEIGDLYGVVHLLCEVTCLSAEAIRTQSKERYDRERKRARSR